MKQYKKVITILIGILIITSFYRVHADIYSEWSNHKTLTFSSGYEGLQVNFNITYGIADNGLDFNCKENFEDLRFVDSLTGQLLSAYNQTTVISNYINIWLKLGTSLSVILYYGNPNAESYWNINETFIDVIGGVVLAYLFNENSGNIAYDYSGNENNGEINVSSFTDGIFGNGLYGNGEHQQIYVAKDDSLNFINAVSICAWVKVETNPESDAVILCKVAGSPLNTWDYWLSINGGKIRLNINLGNSTTQDWLVGNTDILNSNWCFVCGTYNGTYIDVWLNGTRDKDSKAYSYSLAGSDRHLLSFQRGANFYNLNGTMDNLQMFNIGLNSSQIMNMFETYADSQILEGFICCRNWVYEMPTIDFGTEITSQFEQTFGLVLIVLIIVCVIGVYFVLSKKEDKK